MRWALASLLVLVSGIASAQGNWGIGIRTTRASLSSDSDVGSSELFRGGGAQLRWRSGTYWSFELAIESMSTSFTGFDRKNVPVTISTAFHVLGRSAWDLYILTGFGTNQDTASFTTAGGTMATDSAHETSFHLGAGIERALGPFGVGLEVRALGLHRSDSTSSTTIPVDASGHQMSLTCTYYF
jgi:hypothetical protein